jgi:hypothetical protein
LPPSIGDDEVQWVPAREMYDAFVAWAEANAVRPWKEKSFASALVQKGFQRDRTDHAPLSQCEAARCTKGRAQESRQRAAASRCG